MFIILGFGDDVAPSTDAGKALQKLGAVPCYAVLKNTQASTHTHTHTHAHTCTHARTHARTHAHMQGVLQQYFPLTEEQIIFFLLTEQITFFQNRAKR